MSADVSDVLKLAVDLRAASSETRQLAHLAVMKSTADVKRAAMVRAPVDTGMLRNSITGSTTGLVGEIGPTVNYAPYLEYGTYKMSPQPFMGPALEEVAPGFVAAIESIGGDAL